MVRRWLIALWHWRQRRESVRLLGLSAPAVVPAHDQAETIHLKRHYEAHHTRQGDPEYHLFEAAKKRLKEQGLWKCVIGNADCSGEISLHHSDVEFSYSPSVDLNALNRALGLHLSDADFAKWIEEPGNLEPLCMVHHLPGQRFAVHSIPYADWTIVRTHKVGTVPVEVVHPLKERLWL